MAVSCDNDVNDQLIAKTMEMSMDTVSSIDKVPAEILSHIFLLCLPEGSRHGLEPDPSRALLLLCQISSYWRKLAISTPLLWCSISLTEFRTTASRDRSQVSWLQTWLARSRACPLSLYLARATKSHPDDSIHLPSTSVELVVERSQQWRDLEIDNLDLTSFLALCNVPGDAAPLLESFAITYWRDEGDPHPHQITFLHSAPRLQTISLHGNFSLSLCILPWAQISSLHLDMLYRDDISVYDCMHLLSQCLSVTELVVFLSSPEPENQASYIGPPIFLSSLTFLEIGAPWQHTTALLSHVVAPSLLSLQLSFVAYPRPIWSHAAYPRPNWSHAAFLSFIQRLALLKTLRLYNAEISEDQFIGYLKYLPSLTSLDVSWDHGSLWEHGSAVITDRTLELLSLSNSRPRLVPNLEHLQINFTQILSPFCDKAFVDVILSRWDPPTDQPRVACLKSVDLWWSWSYVDAEIKLVFRRLAREGLKITLRDWNSTLVDHDE